ncbi:MAG: VWA domain-containing protein [Candidatus Promineifilaceae bacterium]|nr:VWA domain-containing protein [Candidatus Promineifilaceae bacterium]
MNESANYYAVLGVAPDASQEEIERAARRLGEQFPPAARDPLVNVAYHQLARAYSVLSDPEQRAAYDAERKRQPSVLDLQVYTSRSTLAAGEGAQLLYVLATLAASEREQEASRPLNLCLVFDTSTSMAGERLERIKAAARRVIEKLSTRDVISIVTFSDRATVVVPSCRVNNHALLVARLNTITASGGTEILSGLEAGVNELSKVDPEQYINHLILMTDGHTYGDEQESIALMQHAADERVTMSAFGIGADWNDAFLDRLVTPSGGHSAYIEAPAEIVTYLQDQVQALGATYAENVHFIWNLPVEVSCKYLIRLSPFAQPLRCQGAFIPLGTVETTAPLAVLFELAVDPPRAREVELFLEFEATIPSRGLINKRFGERVTLSVVPEREPLVPPPLIVRAVEMLTLYRLNEKAWAEFEAGDVKQATRRMGRLTQRLVDAGHTELAEHALQETQRLERQGTSTMEGRKRLKYGTRSLFTQTLKLDTDD